MKSKKTVRRLTTAAMIAAIYVVLVQIFQSISFGPIQFRIAEALTILPVFSAAAVPGVSIGCLLANLLFGGNVFDIIFGTLATLIGAIGTRMLRNHPYLGPIPPIVANTVIVPFILRYTYGSPYSIPFLMLTVGAGEVIAVGVLGIIVYRGLKPVKDQLFKEQ